MGEFVDLLQERARKLSHYLRNFDQKDHIDDVQDNQQSQKNQPEYVALYIISDSTQSNAS
jgi:hypothetical protein